MQTVWLILGALLMPLAWGWIVYRLMGSLWPESQTPSTELSPPQLPDPLADYQI